MAAVLEYLTFSMVISIAMEGSTFPLLQSCFSGDGAPHAVAPAAAEQSPEPLRWWQHQQSPRTGDKPLRQKISHNHVFLLRVRG